MWPYSSTTIPAPAAAPYYAVTPPKASRTIADDIADYKATPESVKKSLHRAYGLLIDSGIPIEFDI